METTKCYLLGTAAHNLGRVLWKLLGLGVLQSLEISEATYHGPARILPR